MGWKISTIIVHKPGMVDNEKILNDLGFKKLSKIKDQPFEIAMNPDINKIFMGMYKDNLLICEWRIAEKFITDNEAEVTKILMKVFPDSEICGIALHSVVNFWGYSIIKNGEKIRARAGSGEEGTFIEFGEPQEEEMELLEKSILHENGTRTYFLEDFPNEPYTEDQVGENFVFRICKRYFGEQLDYDDDLLSNAMLNGYAKRPWWKFW